MSDWGAIVAKTDGSFTCTRTREITSDPTTGGEACGSLTEQVSATDPDCIAAHDGCGYSVWNQDTTATEALNADRFLCDFSRTAVKDTCTYTTKKDACLNIDCIETFGAYKLINGICTKPQTISAQPIGTGAACTDPTTLISTNPSVDCSADVINFDGTLAAYGNYVYFPTLIINLGTNGTIYIQRPGDPVPASYSRIFALAPVNRSTRGLINKEDEVFILTTPNLNFITLTGDNMAIISTETYNKDIDYTGINNSNSNKFKISLSTVNYITTMILSPVVEVGEWGISTFSINAPELITTAMSFLDSIPAAPTGYTVGSYNSYCVNKGSTLNTGGDTVSDVSPPPSATYDRSGINRCATACNDISGSACKGFKYISDNTSRMGGGSCYLYSSTGGVITPGYDYKSSSQNLGGVCVARN